MPTSSEIEKQLHSVLERARTAGFLGPGPLRVHTDHAFAFERRIPHQATEVLDLGSGGGVPGIPILVRNPSLHGILLDASEKRCAFLQWAVVELNLASRVSVVRGRAEDLAHRPDLRRRFDAVTCRGFGPPASTIEAAVGFVSPVGVIIVSEPPRGRSWSNDGLDVVALEVQSEEPVIEEMASVASFRPTGELADIYPRPLRQQRSKPLAVLTSA